MKDKTQYTRTNREKRKRRRIKHNAHIQIKRREKRRRVKHNTHMQIERREKEEG